MYFGEVQLISSSVTLAKFEFGNGGEQRASSRIARLQMFFKIGAFKNCQHSPENTERPATLLKSDSNTGFSLGILQDI